MDSVQLENGCVCCSRSEELMVSLIQILKMCQGSPAYDWIVLECTGVAEPRSIRDKFNDYVDSRKSRNQ